MDGSSEQRKAVFQGAYRAIEDSESKRASYFLPGELGTIEFGRRWAKQFERQ